ncbi:MAG: hypothetical protein E7206_02675 [Clostridium beijerinckii]|nr:hypothetical protein [Clostridium beijerinckii]
MKLIGVTQRVEIIQEYSEKRDSLDQKWFEFLNKCDLIPILLPNNLEAAKNMINSLKIEGILLTGGNNLAKCGGDAYERDELEKFCMNFSIKNNIPVLGVCRGMQFIQDYFGLSLELVKGHIARKQKITFYNKEEVVNSFHNWGCRETNDELVAVGNSEDGVIKAVKHVKYRILGIMWHPERINPFAKRDIKIFKEFFGVE